MWIFNFSLVFLAIFGVPESFAQTTGGIWCHSGDKKNFNPMQCEAQTVNCFKFECQNIEEPFTARGCGPSVLTKATGLPNESCHQAQSICEKLGGVSTCFTCDNRHMCNSFGRNLHFLAFFGVFVMVLVVVI